ncbi:MAG: beta-ketoacyl synthase chain length factor [Chitinophagales bacterium]
MMKPVYINGMGCISAARIQEGTEWIAGLPQPESGKLLCTEPDYSAFFEAKNLRRMGRLLKFGTAAGLMALRDAGMERPDAIATGTGLGLLDDSGKFLKSVIDAEEGTVSPTAFIQSTHNTVSSNISVLTGCHAHNFTFSQKGVSFEGAVLDSILLMEENAAMHQILVGAYDEVTAYSYAILERLGAFRHGAVAGEGAAYFVLSLQPTAKSFAKITAFDFGMRATADYVRELVPDDSFVLNGSQLDIPGSYAFKQLCGEYMTASSFGWWLAAALLRYGHAPQALALAPRAFERVAVVNQYKKNSAVVVIEKV